MCINGDAERQSLFDFGFAKKLAQRYEYCTFNVQACTNSLTGRCLTFDVHLIYFESNIEPHDIQMDCLDSFDAEHAAGKLS